MDRETINAVAEAMDDSLLLTDGFDEAFIGIAKRCGQPTLAVYSWEKMLDVLVDRDGMEHDDAAEYIDYNVIGSWVGERTPIVLIEISEIGEEAQDESVTKLESEVEALRNSLKSLERLQDILVRELAAWVQSSPKLLRRWLISRMERERTFMRDL
jgi:hypothetical protein